MIFKKVCGTVGREIALKSLCSVCRCIRRLFHAGLSSITWLPVVLRSDIVGIYELYMCCSGFKKKKSKVGLKIGQGM